MRGYFGIGAEEISKPINLGALMRTSHAFGASFFFTLNAHPKVREAYNSDTSRSFDHMPYYPYDSLDDAAAAERLRAGGRGADGRCGGAAALPASGRPPRMCWGASAARYRRSCIARCAHVVKIPTKFCVNVGLAGALVMYDRLLAHGGYPARPIMPGGPPPDMTEAPKKKN